MSCGALEDDMLSLRMSERSWENRDKDEDKSNLSRSCDFLNWENGNIITIPIILCHGLSAL